MLIINIDHDKLHKLKEQHYKEYSELIKKLLKECNNKEKDYLIELISENNSPYSLNLED